MIPAASKFQHSDPYLRKLSKLSGHPVNVIREIINSQMLELMLQLARDGNVAQTFLGKVNKLDDDSLKLLDTSPYIVSMLKGTVEISDIATELSNSI